MSLKSISEPERLRAALVVARHLHEHSVEFAELHPTGTRFTPIGTDGDLLKVLVETPGGVDTVERISGSWAQSALCNGHRGAAAAR